MSVSLTDDITLCQWLRKTVFIEKQGVSVADEIDGRDHESVHFLAKLDGKPIGTARILIKDDSAKIGRVCVLQKARGRANF